MTKPRARRVRRPRVWTIWVVAGLAVAASATALAVRALRSDGAQTGRPELQQVLDGLVTGPDRIAPGVTAYVSGPRGTWVGSAGVADVGTNAPMSPGTRMRLASVSKAWAAAVILVLVDEGRMHLDDTVERWLPGVLPDGARITVRQLLNHTSGLVDSNDIAHEPRRYMSQVRDPALRARILAASRSLERDPSTEIPPRLWVDFAGALPLRSEPGASYHYSNIGYTVAGLLAERAGGADFATLLRTRIAEPLGLASAAYDPHADIAGDHARGYRLAADGTLEDATEWTMGVGAGGGVVANAADEARFLTALMRGRIVSPRLLDELRTPGTSSGYGLGIGVGPSGCAGLVYGHNGALDGFETNVFVSGDGSRVAVLLLNGRTADGTGDRIAFEAMNRLFCAG